MLGSISARTEELWQGRALSSLCKGSGYGHERRQKARIIPCPDSLGCTKQHPHWPTCHVSTREAFLVGCRTILEGFILKIKQQESGVPIPKRRTKTVERPEVNRGGPKASHQA